MPLINTSPFDVPPAMLCNSNYISGQDFFSPTYLKPREFETPVTNEVDTEDVTWKTLSGGGYGGPPFTTVGGENPTGYDAVVGGNVDPMFFTGPGSARWHWYMHCCDNTSVNISSITRAYYGGTSHAPGYIIRRWIAGGVPSNDPNDVGGSWQVVFNQASGLPNPDTDSLTYQEGYYWWMTIYKFQPQTVDVSYVNLNIG